MTAIMVVSMQLDNEEWTGSYFAHVPTLLAEFGGRQLYGARSVEVLEGGGLPPDRMAVFEFPDVAAAHAFMNDSRYRPYRDARQAGSRSQICLFENAHRSGAIT